MELLARLAGARVTETSVHGPGVSADEGGGGAGEGLLVV
jgi:hypothetical protein